MRPRKHGRTPVEWAGLAVLVMMAVLFLSACNSDDIESLPESKYHLPSLGPGVHQNTPVSTLTADRWTQCYQDFYDNTATPMSTIVSGCSIGNFIMLACRPTGSAILTVAAYAPTADVLTDTGASNNGIFTLSNGVAWFFNDTYSWGFIDPVDTVAFAKSQCSVGLGTFPERQICWHTNAVPNINWGYSCGNATYNGTTHQRLIYSRL